MDPDVQQAVRCGTNCGVQSITLVVELERRLVDRDVIRVCTVCGL